MAANLKQIIWFHNPRANPNWQDDDNYYAWRSEIDGDSEPNQTQLDAAEAAYDNAMANGAILLESDKSSITGDRTDVATITVTFRLPYPDYVVMRVAGLEVEVPFDPKEIGTPFERIAYITVWSGIPGEDIVIEPVEWFADFPGGDPLVIEVTA